MLILLKNFLYLTFLPPFLPPNIRLREDLFLHFRLVRSCVSPNLLDNGLFWLLTRSLFFICFKKLLLFHFFSIYILPNYFSVFVVLISIPYCITLEFTNNFYCFGYVTFFIIYHFRWAKQAFMSRRRCDVLLLGRPDWLRAGEITASLILFMYYFLGHCRLSIERASTLLVVLFLRP